MVETQDICIGRLVTVTDVQCRLDLIFNGARSIKSVPITIDVAAHIKERSVYDEGVGYNVTYQEQVGEGGLKPFLDQVHEKYPNIQLIPHDVFQQMVDAQREAASKEGNE